LKGLWTTTSMWTAIAWIQFYSANHDNRHITTSMWTVPSSFTASFPPHFTCKYDHVASLSCCTGTTGVENSLELWSKSSRENALAPETMPDKETSELSGAVHHVHTLTEPDKYHIFQWFLWILNRSRAIAIASEWRHVCQSWF
jgi:hypothetical protein